MQNYELTRNGLPPIKFTGEKLGHGSTRSVNGSNSNRWTEVDIYRTQGGKYVVSVERHTCWQGESDHYTATSKPTPEEIIQWLKADSESETLGAASQEAVEDAVKVDEKFAAAWVEKVD